VVLADLDVLVVDCQTTGATPHHGDVLEIGWTAVRAARPVHAHRVALPEGREIPRVVSRLTGLVRESLEGALAPAEAYRLLCAAAAEIAGAEGVPAPTVIHFARFELAFLHDLHRRFDPGAPFPFGVVCTHEIARRLLPDLPRRGLRALAGYFGHGVDLERRSAGHVEATAFVWRRLTSELQARGICSFRELEAWLEAPPPPASGRRAFPLPRERRLSLPDAPGVYCFLRTNGDVLYVGKATSLRKRVSSHFTSGRPGERALEMLTQAHEVAATVTASALEAALLESDEIKTIDPPYNVQLRRREHGAWFATPDLRDAAPRPEARGSIGPLPSPFSLSSLAAVRALVSGEAGSLALRARCVGLPPAFAPDEASFAAGWEAFVARRLAPQRSRTPWGALLKASKALFRLWGEGALDEEAAEPDGPREWDAERVRRHIERNVAQGGQLLRRARWLCLLSESSVAWHEPGAATRRLLIIAGADIVERRDLGADAATPVPPGWQRAWLDRQLAFDAVRYDRLRVLATELKRVSAETGDVAVRVDDRHELRAESLARLLRWV
jgi:DNA polymerase-3 subunit epsilon